MQSVRIALSNLPRRQELEVIFSEFPERFLVCLKEEPEYSKIFTMIGNTGFVFGDDDIKKFVSSTLMARFSSVIKELVFTVHLPTLLGKPTAMFSRLIYSKIRTSVALSKQHDAGLNLTVIQYHSSIDDDVLEEINKLDGFYYSHERNGSNIGCYFLTDEELMYIKLMSVPKLLTTELVYDRPNSILEKLGYHNFEEAHISIDFQ